MKQTRYDGSPTRQVLAGMVTDQTVLARISSQWREGGLFDNHQANLVGDWCVNHLRRYGEAPNGQLRGLFDNWAATTKAGEETVRMVERVLEQVSDEHARQDPPPSSDYVLDVAGKLFNRVRLKRVIEEADDDLSHNDVDAAHAKLVEFNRVELGRGALIKPHEDFEVWRQAFDEEASTPLLSYPGRANEFIGSAMVRDALVAVMAPDKTGKSMFLLDAAFRAVKARHRVAYFECGDLSQDEVLRRLGQRAARRPRRPGVLSLPKSVTLQGEAELEKVTFDEGLSPGAGYKAFRRVCGHKDMFRLCCYPNSSQTVAGISTVLRDWEREGWVADAVVIDYADILAPPVGVRDTLDQIDTVWKHLRRLSQEMHCLVLTASQSSAEAYKGGVLRRRHFSGRKTKLAHVNGMLGLNVTEEDKNQGVCRINWVVRRDAAYKESRQLPLAGCLGICCPIIRSP